MMGKDVYQRVLTLLPLVTEGQFFLSCLFEPTLHRQFIDFVDLIPADQRRKVFFTTSLTVPLPDQTMERLSRSDLAFINISIDSLQTDRYETLRKGARFDRFLDNLERLVTIFSRTPDAPPLRYTTVALQSNLAEIPSIVERCAREYRSTLHEVRYVYQVPHLSPEWKKDNLLADDGWRFLETFAASSPHKVLVSLPPAGYYAADQERYSRPPVETLNENPEPLPVALSVSSDGTVSVYGRDQCFDISAIPDPLEFFRELRTRL
jgi:MoaA/NifB/PqqE/SkfB family radical SAM enzyme